MKSPQQRMNARIIATQNYTSAAIIATKVLILAVSVIGLAIVGASALEAMTQIGTVLDQAQQLKGY